MTTSNESLFEQRVALLKQLEESLSAATSAALSLRLERFESETARQQSICLSLTRLHRQLEPMADTHPSVAETRNLALRIRTVSQLHAAVLRRSLRTTNALLCAYRSFADLYSASSVPER